MQTWQNSHPNGCYKQRDVGMNPPAHPTALWTTANYIPPDRRTPEMEAALTESE